MGAIYNSRAKRAGAAGDLERCLNNLNPALSHFRKAAQIYRVNDRVDAADHAKEALRIAAVIEEQIKHIRLVTGAAAAASSQTKG